MKLSPACPGPGAWRFPAWGQSVLRPYQIADNNVTPPPGTPPPAQPDSLRSDHSAADTGKSQAIIDRLTASNQDLLDLLKKQQAVLEDIQYDRRLQNRQITLIEERLEDTLQENAALQVKIAKLQTQLADEASKAADAECARGAVHLQPRRAAGARAARRPGQLICPRRN